MQKKAPTVGNILVIILFVLSCFGLLMFLWESFGGPLPLKPKGYRFTIAFPRTQLLAEQSDVRISGVNVGHVVSLHLGSDGMTHAEVEVSSQYAPIRRNMHAILRQKSLLGETYVQLIPQSRRGGPPLADGGQLPQSQVEPSVTLDDILSAFDAKTRRDFQIWQQSVAVGINGRGEEINGDFAQLQPFAEQGNKLLAILASQEGALRAVVKNTGVVFSAIAGRDHQLESMIVNGEHTFSAAAEASQSWAEAFKELPAFEHNSTIALKELDKFAAVANPYFEEFRPTQRQLTKLLVAAEPFVPEFNGFLTALGPATEAAKRGLPELSKILNLTVPVLENSRPVLHNFDPFLQYTGEYVPEVQAFFANLTAAAAFQGKNSNTAGQGPKQHMLTTLPVLSPTSLAFYATPVGTSRGNPYQLQGAFRQLATGLPVFSAAGCANSAPSVNGPPNETVTKELIQQLSEFRVTNRPETPNGFEPSKREEEEARNEPGNPNKVAAPPCRQQGLFSFNGQSSQFPHVVYSGK
jgi:virulence factor Mce-like protein